MVELVPATAGDCRPKVDDLSSQQRRIPQRKRIPGDNSPSHEFQLSTIERLRKHKAHLIAPRAVSKRVYRMPHDLYALSS
jgi:hypothetical protein